MVNRVIMQISVMPLAIGKFNYNRIKNKKMFTNFPSGDLTQQWLNNMSRDVYRDWDIYKYLYAMFFKIEYIENANFSDIIFSFLYEH